MPTIGENAQQIAHSTVLGAVGGALVGGAAAHENRIAGMTPQTGPSPEVSPVAPATQVADASLAEANAAQASGVTRGAASALAADGQVFTGRSTGAGGGDLHPQVQAAYDAVPAESRTPGFHSECGEGRAVSSSLNAGVNPRGGVICTRTIGPEGSARQAAPRPACSSCQSMLRYFDITDVPPTQ